MAGPARISAKRTPRAKPAKAAPAPRRAAPAPLRDPVSAFVQAKLTVNAPDDAYEREADSVAARILQMPEQTCAPKRDTGSGTGAPIQRAEEEEAQTAPLQREEEEEEEAALQARCAACADEDRREEKTAPEMIQRAEQDEEEALQMARLQRQDEEEEKLQTDRLQRQEEEEEALQTDRLQRQEEEEEALQMDRLQRQEEEEEALQTDRLQRQEEEEEELQAAGAGNPARRRMTARFEDRLRHLKSAGGAPLTLAVRHYMETRFGHSFARVRIHTGAEAATLTREARARAFTVGRHIVFNRAEYRPATDAGRRLIAHELTHVLQQKGGLHSVQREIFNPERQQPARTPQGDDLLRRLERVVGIARGQLPPAIRTIVAEILRLAAHGPDADSLRALLAEDAIAAETRRAIATADHVLRLTVHRNDRGARTEWELLRAGERDPFYNHLEESHGPATIPDGGVDEARISVATPLPPRYRTEPDTEPGTPKPTASPDPAPDTGSTPTRAPQPADGPDTSALEAASVEPKAPETVENADGRGDGAGSDAPAYPRPPVDRDTDDATAEEPAVEVRRAPHGRAAPLDPGAEALVRDVIAGPGAPLPAPIRRDMTALLGGDFSGTRIHHGPRAARAATRLHARAFAARDHVVFGDGQFRPQTRAGCALIAHELTHVRQFHEGRGGAFVKREEDCPPPEPVPEIEVVPSPASASEDPAFNAMEGRTENRAASQSAHGTGEGKSGDANAAAPVTEGENRIHAQSDQVGTMATEAANPPAFDREAFIESVLAEVERIAPDTLNDVMEFKKRGTAGQVKSAVEGEADSAAGDTREPLNDAATADPGPGQSPRTAQDLSVEPPGPQPGSVRADRAMPPPRTDSEVEMRSEAVRAENILREACITRSYMDEHGDPELGAAAQAQDGLQEASEQAPQSYRSEEAEALQSSRAGASQTGAEGVADLFETRAGNFAGVGNEQGAAAAENARKRQEVSAEVDTIFTDTQDKVTARLDTMSTDVATTFDAEANTAVSNFEDFIRTNAEIYENNWLEDLANLIADILFDPPPQEVWDFYAEGRRIFISDMRLAIGKVADIVDTGLTDAKDIVEDGKRRVEEKLSTLGDDLADFRSDIADRMNEKFGGLEGDIEARTGEIRKALGKRYAQALKQMQAIEQQVRDEYSTWVDDAEEAFNAAVDFVTGWIEKLTSVVGGAATRIIREPGKFLRNLGAGIVQGLSMFMDNIGGNIKSAVVTWLTGNLGSAGIQVPTTFDAKSLIGFAMELVGLGLTNIKEIARKIFGRRAVAMIEAGAEGAEHIKQLFDILASEGPKGLFLHLQSEFERIKGEIMEKIGKALAESLVIAGIKKILGIVSGLVSGGAGTVVTIVMTIIDVILWFRDNAAQLSELVSTIAGMAMAVLNGQVGALANAINTLLKRLLPVVLSFVGALVGIGGAVRKIQGIFKAIRRPATRAITALFKRLKSSIRKLLRKAAGRGRGRGGKKEKKLEKRKVRQLIMQAMSKPAKAAEPAAAIAETRAQAESLKRKYQPKLKSGTIRITIIDQAPSGVESDGDIDFSVSMSPATRGAKKYTVRKMPLETVTFLSKAGKGPLYIAEYTRQLSDQEGAINAMQVKTWRANRRKFVKSGRSSESATEQAKFRKQFEAKMLAKERRKEIKKFKDQGFSASDAAARADPIARATVEDFMNKNVALHDPDQIAGGSPAAIKRMGLKRVNSSIGSQWRSRARLLTTAVDRFLRKNGDPKANMKVKLAH